MSKKISELQELINIRGEETLVLAYDSDNYKLSLRKASDWLRALLTKEDVGLGNVDNTSDLDKPISRATQAALDTKAPLVHDHDDRYLIVGETQW